MAAVQYEVTAAAAALEVQYEVDAAAAAALEAERAAAEVAGAAVAVAVAQGKRVVRPTSRPPRAHHQLGIAPLPPLRLAMHSSHTAPCYAYPLPLRQRRHSGPGN